MDNQTNCVTAALADAQWNRAKAEATRSDPADNIAGLGRWWIERTGGQFRLSALAARFLGVDQHAGLASCLIHVEPEDRAAVHDSLRRVIGGDDTGECEFRVRCEGQGLRWLRQQPVSTAEGGLVVAGMLVDLHERNLYERANDCRWWALLPELGALLAGAVPDRSARMERILDHINGLFTVYSAILVYDRNGDLVASTGGDDVARIDDATLGKVLALRTEQDYYVSPFVPSPLYGGQPTYVYHAAMRDPGGATEVIGGIGVVFDAGTEFDAMLRGALGDKTSVQAYFIDRRGSIIASTDPTRPIGTELEIERAMRANENGAGAVSVFTHDEHYAIMGSTVSHGYREFKISDCYRADVVAVVVESFGKVRAAVAEGGTTVALTGNERGSRSSVEYATIFIDGEMFAFAAEDVCEALPASRVSPITVGAAAGRAGVLLLDDGPARPGYVWVFDLGALLAGKMKEVDTSAEVVVVKQGTRAIGLMVSALHGVAKFDRSDIVPTPLACAGNGMLVKQVIKANSGKLLVQVIDTDCRSACSGIRTMCDERAALS